MDFFFSVLDWLICDSEVSRAGNDRMTEGAVEEKRWIFRVAEHSESGIAPKLWNTAGEVEWLSMT